MIRALVFAAALGLAAAATAQPAPQATTAPAAKGEVIDCSKNNANPACKNVTQGGVAAKTVPAGGPKMPAAPVAASAPKAMNYDCTKPGNKNKSVCENVVVPPAGVSAAKPAGAAMPIVAARRSANAAVARNGAARVTSSNAVASTQKNGRVVHYDCTKPGNKTKKACGAK